MKFTTEALSQIYNFSITPNLNLSDLIFSEHDEFMHENSKKLRQWVAENIIHLDYLQTTCNFDENVFLPSIPKSLVVNFVFDEFKKRINFCQIETSEGLLPFCIQGIN